MKVGTANPLLQELRQMAAAAGQKSVQAAVVNSPAQGFGQLIGQALESVSQQQNVADTLAHKVEMGDKSVSLVQAMIATQKAGVALQATVQVRNRLVSAYQEIMNMPI